MKISVKTVADTLYIERSSVFSFFPRLLLSSYVVHFVLLIYIFLGHELIQYLLLLICNWGSARKTGPR